MFFIYLDIYRGSFFKVPIPTPDNFITVKNLVPRDSAIITACKRGDLSTVWELLETKRASVDDITEDNFPPIRVSKLHDLTHGQVVLFNFIYLVCNRERVT